MVVLHPLSDFILFNSVVSDSYPPSYWYEGYCPESGELLRLPRTPLSEKIAHSLIQYLAADERYSREGKMYGILLISLPNGEQRILKAFSGLLNSCSVVEGWVPPIPGRENVALDEARTLTQLEVMKQELRHLKQLTERQQYETKKLEFELQRKEISDRHRISKQQRIVKRQILKETLDGESLTIALEKLDEESRQDGIEGRRFKRQRDEKLQPLKQLIDLSDKRMGELKQQRKELSRQLQTQMHAAYSLMNFFGRSLSLQQLMPSGLPTGTGDCCAPKLLHYAATHNLKPLAMAEFWWGDSYGDKIQGEFYGACAERCQPLMGFLLSGLSQRTGSGAGGEGERENIVLFPIIYEDKWLIAVNKPAGLLSVPGRYHDTQDSVLLRLRNLLPDGMSITAVHRLDRETSGILLLARNKEISIQLSQQFEKRQVRKVYEAVLSGYLSNDAGVIELPLWGDSYNRPYQEVNWEYGKPSMTKFQVMAREGNYTRVKFTPLTGRTHQLRVHAADPRGLGVPILGDRLYGCSDNVASRLHLHARELCFEHPKLGDLRLQVETPF
ncbi:MAG: RluA family pseudouridine synthase [Cyanomargarita calcarea GSE-NOS-MK-12-04C]|jgi:tRNA pseudouridine32 synthase/23S rRNA pseudouridine746 synthase|uniref:RNA pseudouridylate synthase n=1 Tax=Cyanomargarita calcarea GSE-NOS-MK-12-04C TaxID=2839659 RepID=A0A951URP5_9CYAN|nr:RluA family pseudouridine synthase [Cyanomargarita calcarea GSE-NOS-MK-12-04C]